MKIWITRDGQEIPYDQLDDGHLMNIIAMIRRRVDALNAHRMARGLKTRRARDVVPDLADLEAERDRRLDEEKRREMKTEEIESLETFGPLELD